jgi:hypothetical protein
MHEDKRHEREYDHNHEHPHQHGGTDRNPPLVKILEFMQSHNEEHADETAEIAGKLADSGHVAEADIIREGIELVRAGNAKIAEALALLQKK